MDTNTTRRSLLAAMPAAAVMATVPAAAMNAPADRRAWEAALRAYDRVRADDAAFSERYMATWEKCRAECEAVPHVTLRPDPYTGRTQPVSTEDRLYVASARRVVADLDAGKRHHEPLPDLQAHEALLRDVVRAADEREAIVQSIRDRYGMDEADEQGDAIGDALAKAEGDVMDTPAPDLPALRWKLDKALAIEHADEGGNTPCWSHSYVRQTLADIARLMPEGR